MPQITFNVNNKPVSIDAENDDELLYLLRDRLGIDDDMILQLQGDEGDGASGYNYQA